jgi:hypothetical protein
MRAKEFLLEYNRQLTAQKIGSQLLAVANKDMSYRRIQHLQTTPEEFQIDDRWLPDVLNRIEEGDPTPNKIYVPWLAREYIKGNIRRIEDITMFTRPLTVFETYKRRRDFPQNIKDIMRLTSVQFYNAMSQFTPPVESLKDKGRSTQVYKDANVRVIVPEDQTAACYYGQGTTWCTAATHSTNYFNQYNRQGKMYILLPSAPKHDGEKYQLHFASGQFMDEEDEPVDITELLTVRFPELLPFFMEQEPSMKTLVVFADDQVLSTIGNRIQELASEFISETLTEYELNDDSYREWQWEEALRMGIIDPETMDEDEIMDIIHDNDKLNDYFDYNPDARYSYKLLQNSISLSPREIKKFAQQMASEEYDGDGEPVDITEMDEIYKFAVQQYFGGSGYGSSRSRGNDDLGLAEWIYKHIQIEKDGTVKYIPR